MLELENLSKSYRGIPAISNVNFKVNAGEVVGYLGANGSGKSTTVKIITGLLQPNEGRVLFQGGNIRDDLVSFRAALGYVPEEAHLYNYLSGMEYLQLVGRLRGDARAADSDQGPQATPIAWSGIVAAFAHFHVFQGDEAACADCGGADP
jgi:ABC-type multidrug transport system ATPase subunit